MVDRSTGHGYRPLAWLCALGLLALWSCGTPEERYKALSFWFDGVPLPPSMRPQVTDESGNQVALVTVRHAPYANEQCKDCHGEIGEFKMSLEGYAGVKPDICLKCHDGVQNQYPHMHGPVAAVLCLGCHEPHESRYQHLLKKRAPDLCFICHEPGDVQASGAPQHADLTVDCFRCHDGHGGQSRYFLHPDTNPPQPQVAPADQPPPDAQPAQDAQPQVDQPPTRTTSAEGGP